MSDWGRGSRGGRSHWSSRPQFSRPRTAKGGIRAQNVGGQLATSWWAQRWWELLESFGLAARLSRGKSYARRGQVTDISVQTGRVSARVQGSQPQPYEVQIEIEALTETQWDALLQQLRGRTLMSACLHAGEMPREIEEVCAEIGVPLFPASRGDLVTRCSCPDPEQPCKHVSAVYYLLTEQFDRDPFLLLRLRGVERERILQVLGEPNDESQSSNAGGASSDLAPIVPEPEPEVPLPPDPALFWSSSGSVADLPLPPPESSDEPSLLDTLANFPFWRSEEPFVPTLQRIYRAVRRTGLGVLAGEC